MKLQRTEHGTISFFDKHGSFTGYYLDNYTDNNTVRLECYCEDTMVEHRYLFYHDNFHGDHSITYNI